MTTVPPQSKPWEGLSESAAQELLRRHGPNVLPSAKQVTLFSIILDTLKEPMLLLLVSTGVVYLIIGDLREAVAILAGILLVIGISVTQKQRTERTLTALRDLTSPRALVVRAEGTRRIPAREVVPGDVVILNEGDRVPADGIVLESVLLAVDESLLTGESFPVEKHAGEHGRPQDRSGNPVYSGTLVVRGHGIALITSTGAHSEIGKIGAQLGTLVPESTRLERETTNVVRIFGILSLLVCVFVAALYGLLRGEWISGAISALALAISMVPEEFPVVLTIFMAIGAWRISQKKVLTRRFPAIEMLGAATVICADKTGTLTENRMAVHEIFLPQETGSRKTEEALRIAALASEENTADPVDRAIIAAAPAPAPPGEFLREYPLSSDSMLVAKAYRSGNFILIAAKGAPEAILGLSAMQPTERDTFQTALARMTASGMRVIAVAKGVAQSGELPQNKDSLRLEMLALIGLADPIRSTVPGAIAELRSAGVRVVMITGDYPGTASAVASRAGLENATHVITGGDLQRLDEQSLRAVARRCNVFARVTPEQKLRLITAFKANREVVAMTGDGVNDAPALKSAHIGIAMGARGSDVAREAAALVLADDDFPAIVDAVRLGRRIYDNLTNAIRYVIAVHVPVAGLAVLPVLFDWPILLMPLHIVFIELIVDPACSIAFEVEREEPGIMRRTPRLADARLFGQPTVTLGLVQGAAVFVAVLAAFLLALRWGHTHDDARAIAFASLVAGNLALIWTNVSAQRTIFDKHRNPALWLVTLATLAALLAILYVPYLRGIFALSFLHPNDLLVAFSLGAISITWFEIRKVIHRRRSAQPHKPVRTWSPQRLVIVIAGWVFLLAGVAGLFLPVLQGMLFLLIGLLILSKEYRWAGRLITRLRAHYPRLDGWLAKARAMAASFRKD